MTGSAPRSMTPTQTGLHAPAEAGAVPAHRVVVKGTGRRSSAGRVAAVASALACLSGVAVWVGGNEGIARRGAGANELLAAAHFDLAKAELRRQAAAVTRQLYAAEDKDAKSGFRVAKDQARVQQLEQKAERISAELRGPAVKPAREMMLARKHAFASLGSKSAAGGAKVISLSDLGAIIKAVKQADGQMSGPSSPAQPINVNIYLPGAASGKGDPAVTKTTQVAAKQAKERAALRAQLEAQDEQIRKLLASTKPRRAATQLSNAENVKAALSSAVSDMASRLHVENPVELAAQLGVANPVNTQESAVGRAVATKNVAAAQHAQASLVKNVLPASSAAAAAAKETQAQAAAAAKAAHLKKVEEVDGLLLKSAHTDMLVSGPKRPASEAKARTQKLADGSANEQMAALEEKEHEDRHHRQLVQEMNGATPLRREQGGQALDQQESSAFFQQGSVLLPGGQARKLKHEFRSQMYRLDQAAGKDAESMKITGSISDIIPHALFHAMNRQNAIHSMLHPEPKRTGFPARPDSDLVFGHSVQGQVRLPSDNYVIRENNRMLAGLEMAAGRGSSSVAKPARTGDGWGENYAKPAHTGDGWGENYLRQKPPQPWHEDKKSSDAVDDDGDIPVLHDGWGEHDYAVSSKSSEKGLAGWKNQLKSSEESLGFKGLMASQREGGGRQSELSDAEHASRDGWLR